MSEKLTTLSQLRAVSQKSKDRAAQVADTAAAALDEMDADALNVDQAYRLTLLELGITDDTDAS